MTTISIKLRLYPTEEQVNLLDTTMQQYRLACNLVSDYYFENNFEPKQSDLQKRLYRLLRFKFSLKSQMVQSVFKTVLARYKTVNTQFRQRPFKFQDLYTKKWHQEKRDIFCQRLHIYQHPWQSSKN